MRKREGVVVGALIAAAFVVSRSDLARSQPAEGDGSAADTAGSPVDAGVDGAPVLLLNADAMDGSDGSGSGAGSAIDLVQTALDALKTQQQVPSLRGGTLGIPSADTSKGLEIMVSGTALKTEDLPDQRGFDFYTKLGGIQLFNWIAIDLVAESYKQALPQVDLLQRPVLPVMAVGDMRDVGLRIRISDAKTFDVERYTALAREVDPTGDPQRIRDRVLTQRLRLASDKSFVAGVRFLQRPSNATDDSLGHIDGVAYELLGQISHRLADTDETCTAPFADEEQQATTDLEQANTELKSERAAPDAAKRKKKAAARKRAASEKKAVCDQAGYRWTVFAGFSGTHLHTQTIRDEMTNLELPKFNEQRFTVGADVQTSQIVKGVVLLPRFGGYMALTRGSWSDRFATDRASSDITGFQFEGALYVSGHLLGGFNALVSLAALKPYGHDAPFEYIISIAPAIGATFGAK